MTMLALEEPRPLNAHVWQRDVLDWYTQRVA